MSDNANNGQANNNGAAGAANTGGAGAAGAGGAAAAPADWRGGLSPELKAYVETKGFKDPGAALESYQNLEKLMGAPKERLLRLPEKDDAPEWNEIHDRLGRPKEAKDYKFEIPKEIGDEKFAEAARSKFHELGMSQKQAENLVGWWNEQMTGAGTASKEADAQRSKDALSTLQKEWGNAYEQNTKLVDTAAADLGMTPAQVDGLRSTLGPLETMKFLHGLAVKLGGEATFKTGDKRGGPSILTPEVAQGKIEMYKRDKGFMDRLTNKDAQALQEWNGLFAAAYPAN